MMKRWGILTPLLAVCAFSAGAADSLKTTIIGETLAINGGDTKLNAAHWAKPQESWRTVGELAKSALPPAEADGRRPNVTLVVELDNKASWGALKTLLIASANLGIEKAQVTVKGTSPMALVLPGANAGTDDVPFALAEGPASTLVAESGGKKIPCDVTSLTAFVKQNPKAVLTVTAATSLPAGKVASVVTVLQQHHAAVNFLQLKAATAEDIAKRDEAKEAVDKALDGAIGGMGGMGGK